MDIVFWSAFLIFCYLMYFKFLMSGKINNRLSKKREKLEGLNIFLLFGLPPKLANPFPRILVKDIFSCSCRCHSLTIQRPDIQSRDFIREYSGGLNVKGDDFAILIDIQEDISGQKSTSLCLAIIESRIFDKEGNLVDAVIDDFNYIEKDRDLFWSELATMYSSRLIFTRNENNEVIKISLASLHN